jgi:2-polyprenyl-3-methyl-5-hydroxy-6-metoxy-1,4-benzoquinol methylase
MSDAMHLHGRLTREIEHFERHYSQEAAQGIEPLSAFDRKRYSNPPANTIFPREFYYHLLAPLKGKDVLEIACGNGIDANISAYNGANHHAYDITQKSIEMTRRRAEVNGVSDRLHLQACGDFAQAFPGQQFDHVIGYAALHHIPMDGLSQMVYDRLKPGGVAVFAEPVINSKLLDRVRNCIPFYHVTPTEDEVPLNDGDIAEFAKPFDRIVRREFQCVSRIWPFFPNNWPLAVATHKLDHYLMKIPVLRRFASVVVFALHKDR